MTYENMPQAIRQQSKMFGWLQEMFKSPKVEEADEVKCEFCNHYFSMEQVGCIQMDNGLLKRICDECRYNRE